MSIDALRKLISYLRGIIKEMTTGEDITRSQVLYGVAIASLGTDASPKDTAPDLLACADTLTTLIAKIDPTIRWENRLSTAAVRRDMLHNKQFVAVQVPKPGDIIVSATQGKTIGHCGIVLDHDLIASNDSRSGLFDTNYSIASWRNLFEKRKHLEVLFFRMI